jgi:hypothetical protein
VRAGPLRGDVQEQYAALSARRVVTCPGVFSCAVCRFIGRLRTSRGRPQARVRAPAAAALSAAAARRRRAARGTAALTAASGPLGLE